MGGLDALLEFFEISTLLPALFGLRNRALEFLAACIGIFSEPCELLAHAQQFGGQAVGANLLAPPDGSVNTIDDVVAKLEAFAASPDAERTGWIFGVGYDDALLGRHPTRADLDRVSTTVPVMATHISGHFAAVNTLALKTIGYDATTPNPEGGVIRREPLPDGGTLVIVDFPA